MQSSLVSYIRMNELMATKGTLIQVAARLFAEFGYDGTSIRAITREAGANLGAVTYHFGSKENLYLEVVESLWRPAIADAEAAAAGEAPPLDRIENVVRAFLTTLDRHREMALIMAHVLSGNQKVPEPARKGLVRLMGILHDLIERGQAEGSIVRGDARLLILSTLAQPFHITMLRNRMRGVLGIAADTSEVYAKLVDNAVAFVRRGLSSAGNPQ